MTVGFKVDSPKSMTAVGYSRDYSAQGVWDDILEGNMSRFSEEPEFIDYYSSTDWKVYRVTVTIEPMESAQ